MCALTVAAFICAQSLTLLPGSETLLEHWRNCALCPKPHSFLNPSQAINPTYHHWRCIYSLCLSANSPFCISSFFFLLPLDIKATLSYRTRIKEAASAQRNPLKYKTSVDWQAAQYKKRNSWGWASSKKIPSMPWQNKKPHQMTFIYSWMAMEQG